MCGVRSSISDKLGLVGGSGTVTWKELDMPAFTVRDGVIDRVSEPGKGTHMGRAGMSGLTTVHDGVIGSWIVCLNLRLRELSG